VDCAPGREDYSHLSADEIGDHCRQAITYPVVLDRHVSVFDIAGFVKTIPEGGHKTGEGIGRSDLKEPYHRHRPLLRIRRERPHRRRAAEKGDDIASSDAEHGPLLCSTETIAPRRGGK
jgi:hypothetical protein